ncbi:MAG: exodeoxyribonuclease VII large subunit [Oscillospiraceae bacterium]|nr:exodeoxyribonuclease VII large subunit [Oscillospiraceae bacterium]
MPWGLPFSHQEWRDKVDNTILEVSQVNGYLKQVLDQDPLLQRLMIRGELSNYKVYPSGHHYFTMKDSESALRCVMFRSSASRLRFQPENGMKVIASGRITVYPRDGAYQLYCDSLTPEGAGDLAVAFEQLKAKLSAEGLFDPAHKKALPRYPHRIAIVTSSAGAAIHDMLRILKARYPLSKILLLPVRVQGAEAPPEIAGAIRYCNRYQIADLIITGRGGGSMEDLWAFNDERVARAIYDSEIPVISAVGHEPDVTISDYVADLRAATPSNAAELAVPDQQELLQMLDALSGKMAGSMSRKLAFYRQRLDHLSASRVLRSPGQYFADRRISLENLSIRLAGAQKGVVISARGELRRLASALDAMSPLKVLSRGYSLTTTADGATLKSVSQIEIGDSVEIRLPDGRLDAEITGRRNESHE